MSKPIVIDARAAAYAGDPVRILAVTLPSSGRVQVQKQGNWKAAVVASDDTVVVTDTPRVFDYWDMSFNESEQMKEVIAAYNEAIRSDMARIEATIMRYDPKDVIQVRKMDERGQALDFDSYGINNGHMAVLLAIWAARKIHGGHIITNTPMALDGDKDDQDTSLMPFSI